MDEENVESWAAQPDVCRCCLSASGRWDATVSYISDSGVEEVFADMLLECYNITLSHLSEWGPSHLMCALCVGRLRDASAFRKQVLLAEKKFGIYSNNRNESAVIKIEDQQQSCDGFANNFDAANEVSDNEEKEITTSTVPKIKTIKIIKKQEIDHRKRKKQKTLIKKRKRNKMKIDVDYDSDVPIAELSKKIELSGIGLNDDNVGAENLNQLSCETKENNLRDLANKIDISSMGCRLRKQHKEISKMSAETYIDNRNLRSNITLILKNSTILPFKHINNSKYICLYCDKAYIIFKHLQEHVNEKHVNINEKDIIVCLKTPKDLIKADVSKIGCKICEESFDNLENLIEHLVNVHRKTYFHTPRLKPPHGILGFDLSSDKIRCHVCRQEFRFFKNLSVHMNEHSDYFICHICGKQFVSDHRLQTHVIMHRRTENLCKHCNKEFRTVSARNYHIRKVHNDAKFKCPECDQVFGQYQRRLRHLVEAHDLKKPEFRCDVCFKDFASSGGLRAHVKYSHLKTTEYPCTICGKVFVYKWIWRRHLDVHSGTKNYECKYCNKKFAKPYTLQVHTRIHLNDRRFSCLVCKAAFVQKCSLKNHIRVHHSDPGNNLSSL